MNGMYRVYRNRNNPNLFRYETPLARLNHSLEMRKGGMVPKTRWSEVGVDGSRWYFAEYKEVDKA